MRKKIAAGTSSAAENRHPNWIKVTQSNLHSNGHLSTTATFFVPADSPYIDSCLNLYNGNGH